MFTYSKNITQRRQQSAASRPQQQSRLSDNRPEGVAQRKMAQFISGSAINVAQRQKIEGLTGNPIQREGMDDELQMKADQTYQRAGLEEEMV